MMTLESLIPAAFPALALAHFVALLSPGQDFFLITGHAIRHRLRGSWVICLGVAVGNAVYIAVAILGWTGIRDNPRIFTIIEMAGACYLLWIGIQLLRSKRHEVVLGNSADETPSALKQLLLGLNSALLNPKNALFYMSLMAVILGNEVTLPQQLFCGLWMVAVVLVWDLLLATVIGHQRIRSLLNRRVHLIERGAGAILVSFGIGLFTQANGKV